MLILYKGCCLYYNEYFIMKHIFMKESIQVLVLSVLLCCSLYVGAQQSVHSSGGDAFGLSGTVAYSVGQVVYTANDGATGKLSQGVQQAYEVFTVGLPQTVKEINLAVFPNPATDILILQTGATVYTSLSCRLYDVQGRTLQQIQITDRQTQLDLRACAAATYFLEIRQKGQVLQTFKIIKNN